MTITYAEYLKLEQLLSLQQPLSEGPEHDEMLFIVIHQVYELWFKQTIHEIDYLKELLGAHRTPQVLGTLKRVLTILKTMVAQIDILETMTPLEFLSFRSRLQSSSGFQSVQFRELEFLLGIKNEKALSRFPENSPDHQRLSRRFEEPSLWDSYLLFLAAAGHPVPAHTLERDVKQRITPDTLLQTVLIEVYRSDSETTQISERLVDLDEGLQEWRYRHVKMVQRTIGDKQGTGGSMGADYLKTTLFQPIFPDLWAIRTAL